LSPYWQHPYLTRNKRDFLTFGNWPVVATSPT
jgi:hypothetical protein